MKKVHELTDPFVGSEPPTQELQAKLVQEAALFGSCAVGCEYNTPDIMAYPFQEPQAPSIGVPASGVYVTTSGSFWESALRNLMESQTPGDWERGCMYASFLGCLTALAVVWRPEIIRYANPKLGSAPLTLVDRSSTTFHLSYPGVATLARQVSQDNVGKLAFSSPPQRKPDECIQYTGRPIASWYYSNPFAPNATKEGSLMTAADCLSATWVLSHLRTELQKGMQR